MYHHQVLTEIVGSKCRLEALCCSAGTKGRPRTEAKSKLTFCMSDELFVSSLEEALQKKTKPERIKV